MDIHRCRFVPYSPAAINAVAFSHPRATSNEQIASARLAIGRENGDIEIWNPLNGTWLQEKVLRSGEKRSVDGLVWVVEPDRRLPEGKLVSGRLRLFSIAGNNTVTEWDLDNGVPKQHANGPHGDIWCIAAQPVPPNRAAAKSNGPADAAPTPSAPITKLVVGTMNGELVMYSIEDGELRFQRVFVRAQTKRAQILSIAFQQAHIVVAGCSDSSIRIYDMKRSTMLRTMTLGADFSGGSREIIVWSVKCLAGGDIASADSAGQVCIWDGRTYTLAQRIQSHKQDALSLATSADGTMILSGGMDRRTVMYKKTAGVDRWTRIWGRRYHSHDVKALASFESSKMSVVVSGGPDAAPVILPLQELGLENHRQLPHLPQKSIISSAAEARFLVSWWGQEVHLWSIPSSSSSTKALVEGRADTEAGRSPGQKLLKKILLSGDSSIVSTAITPDGTLLVVSTSTCIKAFQLRHHHSSSPSEIQLSAVAFPANLAKAEAAKLCLSPDGKWLSVVLNDSDVRVLRIVQEDESDSNAPSTSFHPRAQKLRRLRRDLPRHRLLSGLGAYNRSIAQVAFSPDGRMLAVADLSGYIDTWVLREGADSDVASNASASSAEESEVEDEADPAIQGSRWIRNPNASLIPKLPGTPVILSFSQQIPSRLPPSKTSQTGDSDQSDDYTLLAITSGPLNIIVLHPLQGSLALWSRRNRRHYLPEQIRELRDIPKGVVWHGSRVWVYGVSFVFMLDLAQDLDAVGEPAGSAADDLTALLPYGKAEKRKRKRPAHDSGAGSRMEKGALGPEVVQRLVTGREDASEAFTQKPFYDGEGGANGDSDEDMEDVEDEGELRALRGGQQQQQQQLDVYDEKRKGDGSRRWLITYKYRPILGIVPLQSSTAPGQQVEVALVERPLWHIDMPERYYQENEWERK